MGHRKHHSKPPGAFPRHLRLAPRRLRDESRPTVAHVALLPESRRRCRPSRLCEKVRQRAGRPRIPRLLHHAHRRALCDQRAVFHRRKNQPQLPARAIHLHPPRDRPARRAEVHAHHRHSKSGTGPSKGLCHEPPQTGGRVRDTQGIRRALRRSDEGRDVPRRLRDLRHATRPKRHHPRHRPQRLVEGLRAHRRQRPRSPVRPDPFPRHHEVEFLHRPHARAGVEEAQVLDPCGSGRVERGLGHHRFRIPRLRGHRALRGHRRHDAA